VRRAPRLALWALVGVTACRGEDAYLGGGHETYVCGERCAIEQGAPADSGDWFWNPDSELGAAPEVVYPLSGSAHPVDLRQLTVQFRRGRADFRVFRVRVEAVEQRLAFDFFTPCIAVGDDGCRYALEPTVWDAARAELVGKSLRLSVTGSAGVQGAQRSSPAVPLSVVDTNLRNKGFYYWASVPQYSGSNVPRTGIFRLPFGADQAEPFLMPGTATNERDCGACHSVSSDGSTIAFTARDDDASPDQRSGSLVVKVTAQPNRRLFEPAGSYDSSMMALTSNGKRVLVAYDQQLVLRSAENDVASGYAPGDVITRLTAEDLGGKAGYFPEFSPDDDAVVVTLSDEQDSAIAVRAGDIAVLSYDAASGKFGRASVIAEGTEDVFNFYPTWSPDGRYVAFASAPRGLDEGGQLRKSYDQKMARLRLVGREGGEIHELSNATHQLEKWSTYPKFAPFSVGQSGSQFFLTFNSKINYGLLLDNDARLDSQRIAQLWMSEVDVTKLPDDPSSAPIWLPFQDPTAPGHLGIWTKEVKCRTDQGGAACAAGQRCEANVCVVVPK
jgi:WD40-like Beta Propeller Repeat